MRVSVRQRQWKGVAVRLAPVLKATTYSAAGFGVTRLNALGANGPVEVVLTVVKRKELGRVVALVKSFDPCVFYSVDDLHSASTNVNKQTALTEKGEGISGSGDAVNTHDILTGSDPQGLYSTAGGDTNCGNWTKSAEGSAIVGHHDRAGLKKDTRHMKSWNSSHGSRGCSQDLLKASGGAGLIYCFVAN